MVKFEVLGSLRAFRGDGDAVSPSGLQGYLLATLLAHANQPVTADRLIETMWGPAPDAGAGHRLQTHMYRLRRVLGDEADISSEPGSYRLSTSPGELDSEQFESLVEEAQRTSTQDTQRAVKCLRQALTLWHGEAFDGFDTIEIRAQARRLHDVRLFAVEQLYSAELKCGNHDVVSKELPALVDAHPLQEKLHELLILSHALSGRQADALAAYRRARSVLVEELGIEPGPRLREIERQIFSGEPLERWEPTPKAAPTPAQLPGRPGGFVGREEELRLLNAFSAETGSCPKVITVTGGAGVGKTALVLHWAHQLREMFPEGQLYVDLRGFGPDAPACPAQALASFLGGLGVESHMIPDGLDERAALFRSQTADRRVLILLDNARDVDQVRPLLPGTPSCTVAVTSRTALLGLSVQEGARHMALTRMSDDEASALVTQLLDFPDVPEEVSRLIEICAHLPLALRIAAERVRAFAAADLRTLLAGLEDEAARLDLLDGGDERSSVRGVFFWSYQELDEDAAWLFRCLGASPAHAMTSSALAAMTALSSRATRRGLEALRRAHLVEPIGHDRFGLHDLLRTFAVELSEEIDGEDQHSEAFSRLCDHYLRTTGAALEQIMPEELFFPEARTMLDDDTHRPFHDAEDASHWLEAERENLVLVAEQAIREGPHSYPTTLSRLLRRYLDTKSLHDDARRVHSAAVAAARCCGSPQDEGGALRVLGLLAMRRDRFDEAVQDLLAALELHEKAGERRQAAHDNNLLGGAYMYTGRIAEAHEHYESSIAEYRVLEDPAGSFAMGNYGLLHHILGAPREALKWLEISLKVSEDHGKRHSECSTLRNLVAVHRDLGQYAQALDCARRGLNMAEELGRTTAEAEILTRAGTVHQRRDQLQEAQEHHLQALSIADSLDDRKTTAAAHNGLAEAARAGRDLDAACHHHQTALDLSRAFWDEHSRTLIGLGETCCQLGDDAGAVEHWQQALTIYESVGHALVQQLRSRISHVQDVLLERSPAPSRTR